MTATAELNEQVERVINARRFEHARGHGVEEAVQHGLMLCRLVEAGVPVGLRTNVGVDALSRNLMGFVQGPAGVTGFGGIASGTSGTAPTATTFTATGNNFAANSLAGCYVITTSGANRFGIIQSNTSATNSVLTIDQWYDPNALPADRGTAAASTPTAGAYVIIGGAQAAYMGLADNATATAPAATDTTLTGEIDNASNAGLIRKLATYAHTAASGGAGTTTLTKTWTANGNDSLGSAVTISQIGVFAGVLRTASLMYFKTALNANATITTSGDQIQVTETVTL